MRLNLEKGLADEEHDAEDNLPLYHAKGPSAFSVFHKQSIGFLYSVPTNLPFGSCFVGWLYTRVKAYCVGLEEG